MLKPGVGQEELQRIIKGKSSVVMGKVFCNIQDSAQDWVYNILDSKNLDISQTVLISRNDIESMEDHDTCTFLFYHTGKNTPEDIYNGANHTLGSTKLKKAMRVTHIFNISKEILSSMMNSSTQNIEISMKVLEEFCEKNDIAFEIKLIPMTTQHVEVYTLN